MAVGSCGGDAEGGRVKPAFRGPRSSSRALDRVALRLELADHDVAVIALYLDHAVLRRAATAAAPLDLPRELAQRSLAERYALDRRDRLAAASRDLAPHAHDSIAVAPGAAGVRAAHALLHGPAAV